MESIFKKNTRDRILIFLLLLTSGDPVFYKQAWSPVGIIVIGFMLLIYYRARLKKAFYANFFAYISVFLVIFLLQYLNLGSSQLTFIIGFIIKMFIGVVIFTVIGERFSVVFLEVMYFVCLVSLPFYMLHLAFGDNLFSGLYLQDDSRSIGLYTFRGRAPGESILRNSGMFWEPTAFQGYINVALFLNFRRLPFLMKKRRKVLFVLLLTFVTTFSTTGFFLFSVLVLTYLLIYTRINKALAIITCVIFLIVGVIVFNSVDFLGTKVQAQYDAAAENNGDFSNTRFGALLFDWHYIAKNPLTGNGFDPETRFADDPEIVHMIEKGDNPGLGNGFSDFIASAGVIGMFWYFFVLYRFVKRISAKDAFMLIVVMIIALQAESYLRFPFFLGIPFLTPLLVKKHEPQISHTPNLS